MILYCHYVSRQNAHMNILHKFFLSISIVGVIQCVFFSDFSLPTSVQAHGNLHEELIIRITENGFEPKELTVSEGDEVIFLNNDNKDHWPASDFHPTHTLYEEFDTRKGIRPGESWKFKFEKTGSWRIHDHLFPHMTGIIVVLENTEKNSKKSSQTSEKNYWMDDNTGGVWEKIKIYVKNLWVKIFGFGNNEKNKNIDSGIDPEILAEFKNLKEDEKYAWLENRAKTESPKSAWQYVKVVYETPNGVIGNPHDMAHLVGRLIYTDEGFDGLKICEPVFAFGCFHGLMEAALSKNRSNLDEYIKDIVKAGDSCKYLEETSLQSYRSCAHGIGHGIATFREYYIEKSLKDCAVLDPDIQTNCQDGVFMEFSNNAPPIFYKSENPIYPCDSIDEVYKGNCARAQAQVMRFRFKMDTESVAKTCVETKNENIIYNCIDALGYFIAQSSNTNPSKIVSSCKEIPYEKESAQCLAAAAGELVFQDYIGWRESTAFICGTLAGKYQIDCQKRIDQVAQSYGRN